MSEWRPVLGFEGIYEVSDAGQVRSMPREIVAKNGVRKNLKGRVLTPGSTRGYMTLSLWRDGRQGRVAQVHRLVMESFRGPKTNAEIVVRHLDGNPRNNSLANLAYGTPGENNHDTVRHGRHAGANKTHCKQGHEFTEANTIRDDRQRRCRTCISTWASNRYLRNKAEMAGGAS